jgi:hypothetical protein
LGTVVNAEAVANFGVWCTRHRFRFVLPLLWSPTTMSSDPQPLYRGLMFLIRCFCDPDVRPLDVLQKPPTFVGRTDCG